MPLCPDGIAMCQACGVETQAEGEGILGGTHFVNLEKSSPQLFAETLLFLDGADEALNELK